MAEGAKDEAGKESPGDTARKAGRGGLAVGAAKVFFLVVGFVQQVLLARVLGPEGYGALSRVLAIANIANNVVISGGIQGASRAIAQTPEEGRPATQRRVLLTHAALALPLAALFFFVGPFVAVRTGGAHVVPHLRVLSIVVLAYTVYAAFVGVMNGRELFGKQASVDVLFGTLRTIGLVVGGYLLVKHGFRIGALGSVMGFATAALIIVPVAARLVGLGRASTEAGAAPEGKAALRGYLIFLGNLVVVQLLLNALMQADITLLGRFSTDSALASGLTGEPAAAAADKVVAIYRACQLFSFLPYQLLFAITFILFPLLAKAHGEGDAAAVATFVRNGNRLALLFGGAIVAVTAGLPGGVLHLAFKPEIADPATAVLRALVLGQGAFALFGVCTTVLNSTGHERTTVALNAVALALVVGLAYLLVPGASLELLPRKMALAVAGGLAGALILGAIAVRTHVGALVSFLSVARIGGSLALAATAGSFLPAAGKIVTLGYAVVVGMVYLVGLLVTRELGAADFALVQRVLGRKKAAT